MASFEKRVERAPHAIASVAAACGRRIIALFILTILASAAMAEQQFLAGTDWRPVEIEGAPVPDDAPLFIRFDETGKISAHGGCNRMFGGYEIDAANPANLSFGPIAATRKACPPDIMAREAAFTRALGATRLCLRDTNRLTLKTAQGVTTLRLVQIN